MFRTDLHTFHIPVMGIGYTIDTPIKVAPWGISSVISLVDDLLMEKMRAWYSKKWDLPFHPITDKTEDSRAKRITAYLDMVDELVSKKVDEIKQSSLQIGGACARYMELLPDTSLVKQSYFQLFQHSNALEIKMWVDKHIEAGSIDVNIMTKLDKENYKNGEKLPAAFNDGHAALRGFAQSTLRGAIVLSAGMNPRLYSYLDQFPDFFPDADGRLKKKIILKVSDFRSALIQGKFLAKKGLWVSEYRIESGLNCGGHAFASQGELMGPILELFKTNRQQLHKEVHAIFVDALMSKNLMIPSSMLPFKITVQGGVGTAEEHQFLLENYDLNSIGWGTPFLLVPEATNVDKDTLDLLCKSTEKDLYLSTISPFGVPFNSLRSNTKDLEKEQNILLGSPGAHCTKKFAQLNKEFTERAICTASKQYQKLKITELKTKNLTDTEYQKAYRRIVEKSCICVGLGTSALLNHHLDTTSEGSGVSVCPGPNMAYFSKPVSLKTMVDHIYGRTNIIERSDRKNIFINELKINIDYLQQQMDDAPQPWDAKQKENFTVYSNQLLEGIDYYKHLFPNTKDNMAIFRNTFLDELGVLERRLTALQTVGAIG
ncbi:hypothetical protein [Microbacter margulisiae]|uniref:Uncharacterized protein n=1 Tax=Microbacter margulisiae TaxID=1350067 RepID=A0A7W5DT79_9PORP|nr:hypothetical protein [Microbacter margulisiae]MBB3187813.1 hypothetical protein [Microbacter margulisiae]